MARVGVPVFVLLALAIGAFSMIHSRGNTELVAAGSGSDLPHQRVWVIPTFLNEPLEAIAILHETPKPAEGSASFAHSDNPDRSILVFTSADGVLADSGTPVDINGVDGYIQIDESMMTTDIEWRAGDSWQVFQTHHLSETDAIDAARIFQSAGADGLAGLGWNQMDEPEPQEVVTILSPGIGALIFQDEPIAGPLSDAAAAESNGFTVYAPTNVGSQLFVSYHGRLVFSYAPDDMAPKINPTQLANSLDIVTESHFQAWMATWSIMGGDGALDS